VNPDVVARSLIPTRQNSQFPAVGVPDPPPTEFAEVNARTMLCHALGVVENAVGWVNVADH
jgi:hypothetical protein